MCMMVITCMDHGCMFLTLCIYGECSLDLLVLLLLLLLPLDQAFGVL
jgi:hypothetical protein